jgi:hypothetical protein
MRRGYWLLASELTPQPPLFPEAQFEGGFSNRGGVGRGRIGGRG